MSLFRRSQKGSSNQKKAKKKTLQETDQSTDDEAVWQFHKQVEDLDKARKQQEEAYRLQQEASERELSRLDERVDGVLSENSEDFLRQVKQPGGE